MGSCSSALNVCCASIRGATLKCKLSAPSSTELKKNLYRQEFPPLTRIPPLQHIPNHTRPYFVHGFSTLSKKNLKFSKSVYIKVKAWIMHPLDFSWGSYVRGEALQSNIDPSICNSNPDSRLSLWMEKNIPKGTAHYNKKLLPSGMSLPDESVTGTLFSATANISTTVRPSPFEQEILSKCKFVTWQLLKSVLLQCTSATYLH